MKQFYGYLGTEPLGKERLGTEGRFLFRLKTDLGARRRMERMAQGKSWTLYRYSNFYDDSTFLQVGTCG